MASALSAFFANDAVPAHVDVEKALSRSGIRDSTPSGTRTPARILMALFLADRDQGLRFAEELLKILRSNQAFEEPRIAGLVRAAQKAFRDAGWKSDEKGYPVWSDDLASHEEHRNGMPAARVTVVGKAAAARDRAIASPKGVVGESVSPVEELPTSVDPKHKMLKRSGPKAIERPMNIFLVHGHDDAARDTVDLFVRRTTGIAPIVLMMQPSRGDTVIEKFEAYAETTSYALILMTPDDLGNAKLSAEGGDLNLRPRQNVVFEFGYFVKSLGRANVAALIAPGVEKPSDLAGLVYINYSQTSDWKEELRREMKAAGIPLV